MRNIVNLVPLPNDEKKHVLFRALLPSCRNDFLAFEDFPYRDMIKKIIKNKALHEYFNEPLDHMKTKPILRPSFSGRDKVTLHPKPSKVRMVPRVSYDNIEVASNGFLPR